VHYNKCMQQLTYITKPSASAKDVEDKVRRHLEGIEFNESLVIAIGGDGTMLSAIKEHLNDGAIFIGVSAGSLGLLQTVSVNDLPFLASALTSGEYELIKAPLLVASHCRVIDQNAKNDELTEVIGYAFNDISVERQESRAAKFHLKVDNSTGNFVGDGIIFSTPLGSTAYSLAAGGPIIDSEIQDAYVVTPNNPHVSNLHSSLYRPHVLNKSRKIRIELNEDDKKDRPLQIAIDGQIAARDIATPIQICLSDKYVKILQLEKNSLDKRIEEKRLGRL
jgi:NAD+ kinase